MKAFLRLDTALVVLGSLIITGALVIAQAQELKTRPLSATQVATIPEILTLKQQIQSLSEQLYAAQLQGARCSVQLADYQLKEQAGKIAADRQAVDAETIKALGGDPATDVLTDDKTALVPRPKPEAVKP